MLPITRSTYALCHGDRGAEINSSIPSVDGGSAFPGHDGELETDSFGTAWEFLAPAGSSVGPILAGDPDWTVAVPGALLWGGGGTHYTPPGLAACGQTGLDTQDVVAVDSPGSGLPPGCFNNNNGCGGPSNSPFASFQTALFGEQIVPIGMRSSFCEPAGINSSGNAAVLSASMNTTGSGIHLNAAGRPASVGGAFGFFLIADTNARSIPLGDGSLCLRGTTGRFGPASGGFLNPLGVWNDEGNFANLAGTSASEIGFDVPSDLPANIGGTITVGSTWHFQVWFRDRNPSSTFNLSSGLSLTF